MKRRAGLLATASLASAMVLSGATGSFAQVQIGASHFYKVASRGQRVMIDSYFSLDPTCHSLGAASINLLTQPQYGVVETTRGSSFPKFGAGNPRVACNTRKLPSTMLYYKAGPSYTGREVFDVEVVFPDGYARKYRYALMVR